MFMSRKVCSLEDFENGIKSYQSALRIDARHYNVWYGLGMVYLRQEKFEFTEHALKSVGPGNRLLLLPSSFASTLMVDAFLLIPVEGSSIWAFSLNLSHP
ncbi:cell division cycle protein 27 homolog B-like [Macadamia integrifolia]|uniref:cell division cycle protein 27 homolog B-like n=1 Tax=Macadamia integrifolia TaxID=60698 RepID=UPI001C4FF6C4|nr:cell division cycle protein 27 homolog B-like [Macadamia integrifolia]